MLIPNIYGFQMFIIKTFQFFCSRDGICICKIYLAICICPYFHVKGSFIQVLWTRLADLSSQPKPVHEGIVKNLL